MFNFNLFYFRSSQSKKEKSRLESTNSVNSQPAELHQTLESPLLPIDPPKAPKHFQSPDFTRNESGKIDLLLLNEVYLILITYLFC